jgi:hypothetical protein
MSLNPGTKVRMNATCKKALFKTDSLEHVREFGRCIGEVIGPTDWGGGVVGPELDVRWTPSQLKYCYPPEHLQVVHLKAWIVSCAVKDWNEGSVMVHAYTSAQARSIGRGELDMDYIDAHVRRAPEYDERAKTRKKAGIECDDAFLRSEGWHTEGDDACEACGLHSMENDKFAVCSDCGNCVECGCAEDCPDHDA